MPARFLESALAVASVVAFILACESGFRYSP